MNYQQTIDFLFAQLPMFSRDGAAAIKKDLTNTIALCAILNNPQKSFKTIHIAGTNGKGSVSHMLASVFQQAGYKTGLYTSPHLFDFRERIKVNGVECEKEFVIDFVETIQPHLSRIQPSFFEITVAMAFAYFNKSKVDIAIIETGLGGRLDSTNIIHPELSLITNIGKDHMQLLGNSLEEIAFEKAGIIKPKVPVVISEFQPITATIFDQTAKQRGSPIYYASQLFSINNSYYDKDGYHFKVEENASKNSTSYLLDLLGIYQKKNLLGVLAALKILKSIGWTFTEEDIYSGLNHVKATTGLHGRWEQIKQNPRIMIDVAHNEDGVKQLMDQLKITPYQRLHLILGFVRDKELDPILGMLPKEAYYYFTKAQIPRALEQEALANQAEKFGLIGNIFKSVNKAIEMAEQNYQNGDLIVVFGSFFLIAEIEK